MSDVVNSLPADVANPLLAGRAKESWVTHVARLRREIAERQAELSDLLCGNLKKKANVSPADLKAFIRSWSAG